MREILSFTLDPQGNGHVKRFGIPKRDAFAVMNDSSAPTTAFVVPTYAQDSRDGTAFEPSHILIILLLSCFAEIVPSVVALVSVFVINLSKRPLSGHVKPRKSVGVIADVIEFQRYIAFTLLASGTLAWRALFAKRSPREQAGCWIVVKKFAQALNRDTVFFSHAAAFLRGWGCDQSRRAFAAFRRFAILPASCAAIEARIA